MNAVHFSVAALVLFVGGCTVGPDYHAPAPAMPGSFTVAIPQTQPSTQPTAATSPATRPTDLTRWWQSLEDPELDSLIERAVAANPDLEIAFTRLQEARTQEAVVWGQALPEADLKGGAARGSGNNSPKSRDSGPLDAATNTTGYKEITQVYGIEGSWDLDLFGKYRRLIEAARYDTQAAAEARNTVLIALLSDVAQAYMDNRTLQQRLSIANADVQAEQQTVDLLQTRFNRGLINELDLALARRELASAQAVVAPFHAGVAQAQRRLAVLLGRFPEELDKELSAAQAMPQPPEGIQPGLPVDLLRRRPDIRQAERQLAAATARIGVATADLFPSVGFTAGAGFQGQGLGRTPEKTSSIWSAGPTAYFPLLDFGTLDALVSIQDLETHAAMVNYRRTILSAVEEVNDAIANYQAQKDRLTSLGQALVASQQAVNLASKRYNRGLTDFLNVLDAQRQYYILQDQYASAQEALVFQFIALYEGLGGGWEGFAPAAPPAAPRPAVFAAFDRLLHPTTLPDPPPAAANHK